MFVKKILLLIITIYLAIIVSALPSPGNQADSPSTTKWISTLGGRAFQSEKTGARAQSVLDPSPILNGVSSVCALGVPGPLWALNSTPVSVVAGDEDTTPVPSVVAMASGTGNGRVMALGHEGFLVDEFLNLFDNKQFGNNVVDWLDKQGRQKIMFTTGHGELLGWGLNAFVIELESRGYIITRYSEVLTSSALSDIGVIIIGNAWGEIAPSEIEVVKNFVADGGGLFLIGLGWSYLGYVSNATLENYPMNMIGENFGIRWLDGYITDPTNNYEGQPIFYTFYPNIDLQTIDQAFSYIDATTSAHPSDLPSLLQNNASLRTKYVSAHMLLRTASMDLSRSSSQRQTIYDYYESLISSYPQYFSKSVEYDENTQSTMAWVRELVYRSFISALIYGSGLTESEKTEIATTIGLYGRYLDIWNEFTVLLMDNTGLSQSQKDFIYNLLSLIPKDLHNLHSISVIDYLGSLPVSTPEITLWGKNDGVNIFGFDIGVIQENGFPGDVSPKYSDVFSLVVVHEVNHVVDAFYISNNAKLEGEKDDLIGRAGYDHLNYLRSMLPDGFFVSAPQEFFASISNQWFSSTNHTLLLALARFDSGYNEPLNQFLFFAKIYSMNYYTLFYELDTFGNIVKKKIPITRDKKGYINSICINKTTYRFIMDENGYVVDYSSSPTPSISETKDNLFNAPYHSVYFVPTGNIYDDSAFYAFYAYKENPQIIAPPTQSPASSACLDGDGKPLFTEDIVSFGGRFANRMVSYYEDAGIALVGYGWDGTNHLFTRISDGSTLYAVDGSTYNADEKDYFVFQTYKDEDRFIFSEWGICAEGTYAGGVCFIDIIYPNIQDYTEQYYIFSWTDSNNDDMPQPEEITLEASGI